MNLNLDLKRFFLKAKGCFGYFKTKVKCKKNNFCDSPLPDVG